jgi:DNA-binding NarL/FixJ family response regulator
MTTNAMAVNDLRSALARKAKAQESRARIAAPIVRKRARIVLLVAEADQDDFLDQLSIYFPDIKTYKLSANSDFDHAVRLKMQCRAYKEAAPQLTNRQRDILRGLLEGRANKEIGRMLNLSHFTVRNHVANLFKVFGVKSRRELLAKFCDQNNALSNPNV